VVPGLFCWLDAERHNQRLEKKAMSAAVLIIIGIGFLISCRLGGLLLILVGLGGSNLLVELWAKIVQLFHF
jgi:hypothetical protein